MTVSNLSIFTYAIYSTYGTKGCHVGSPIDAFDYVRRAGGVTLDRLYPYDISASICDKNKKDFTVAVVNHHVLRGEQEMIDYVLGGGTLLVPVDATKWDKYIGGRIFLQKDGGRTINHAVNIVGVNVTGGYWIIRNSWGDLWGEKGYMKLQLVCIQLSPS
jgi:C1A family cysteine protease